MLVGPAVMTRILAPGRGGDIARDGAESVVRLSLNQVAIGPAERD